MKAITLVLLLFVGQNAWSQKISGLFGFYNIQAQSTNAGNTVNLALSRLGNYQLMGHFEMLDSIDMGVGYSIFYSRTLGGDMGFGPDIFFNYFPVTKGSKKTWSGGNVTLISHEYVRPYVGIAFHQRQFQSVQTSYSGFGLQGGLEWSQTEEWGYHFKLGLQSLVGPSSLNFRFLDISAGFQFYLP